jgi:hypothetical protein
MFDTLSFVKFGNLVWQMSHNYFCWQGNPRLLKVVYMSQSLVIRIPYAVFANVCWVLLPMNKEGFVSFRCVVFFGRVWCFGIWGLSISVLQYFSVLGRGTAYVAWHACISIVHSTQCIGVQYARNANQLDSHKYQVPKNPVLPVPSDVVWMRFSSFEFWH